MRSHGAASSIASGDPSSRAQICSSVSRLVPDAGGARRPRSTGDEQLDGRRAVQRRHRSDLLPESRSTVVLVARTLSRGAGAEQLAKRRNPVDQMFEVVEHEQKLERSRDGRAISSGHEAPPASRRPSARPIDGSSRAGSRSAASSTSSAPSASSSPTSAADLEGQPRLTDAARPDQRDKRPVSRESSRSNLGDLLARARSWPSPVRACGARVPSTWPRLTASSSEVVLLQDPPLELAQLRSGIEPLLLHQYLAPASGSRRAHRPGAPRGRARASAGCAVDPAADASRPAARARPAPRGGGRARDPRSSSSSTHCQAQLVQARGLAAREGLDRRGPASGGPRHRASARPSSDRANLALPSARARLPSANSASKRSASSLALLDEQHVSRASRHEPTRRQTRGEPARRTDAGRSPPNQADPRPRTPRSARPPTGHCPARRSSAASRARCRRAVSRTGAPATTNSKRTEHAKIHRRPP